VRHCIGKQDGYPHEPADHDHGQTVATVAMTPASGGSLLNGSLLIQQAAYSAFATRTPALRPPRPRCPSGFQHRGGIFQRRYSDRRRQRGSLVWLLHLVPASSSLNINVTGGSSAPVAVDGRLAGCRWRRDAAGLRRPDLAGVTASLIADDNAADQLGCHQAGLMNGMGMRAR